AQVEVYVSRFAEREIPAHQLDILQQMGILAQSGTIPAFGEAADLILDGLIGYSLAGHPRGITAELMRWANQQNTPILALDTPSGIDLSSGTIYEPVIKAVATLTLALPKVGLFREAAAAKVGELYLGDISVPPQLYASPALQLKVGPIFAESDIVRLQ
ncbi:MAG: NAD(P)H-hydrate epimerase, partial [Bacteroidota bacterium]